MYANQETKPNKPNKPNHFFSLWVVLEHSPQPGGFDIRAGVGGSDPLVQEGRGVWGGLDPPPLVQEGRNR